ncbi:MAG TPA: LytTR family DNA-binding domain-containing protein [Gemmatimonadales bacterium]|nr:LytTR family DNA-binding domain-containing protein [Gemmatimonadales bacterium]
MEIRTLVVDDEPLAQRRITRLLKHEPDVTVVGVANNGREAVEAIRAHTPDLVMLDVQMPGMGGFDVVRALDPERMPVIIFITAYDSYALQAFDVHALDYLLKPFKAIRFREAIERARAQIAQRQPLARAQLRAVAEEMSRKVESTEPPLPLDEEPGASPLTRILVRDQGKMFFVRTADVDWFESDGNYIRIHIGERQHMIRGRINNLERRLDSDQFVRIHRSTVVNLDRIKEVYAWFGGDYMVVLADGTQLKLTRKHRDRLSRHIV